MTSTIAIKNDDDTIIGIYIDKQSETKTIGKILLEDYNTEAKIKALLELGDCSSIDNGIDAYYRDRGEDWIIVETTHSKNYNEFLDKKGQVINYLFQGGEWWFIDLHYDEPILLEDVL